MNGNDPDPRDWAPPAVELGEYLSDHGYTVKQERGTHFHELVAVRGNVRFEVDWWLKRHVRTDMGWYTRDSRWARALARIRGHDWWPGVQRLVTIRDPLHIPAGVTEEDFAEWRIHYFADLPCCHLRTEGDVRRLARLDEATIVGWVRRKWRASRHSSRPNRQRRVFPSAS